MADPRKGPLAGLKVVEMVGIGPAPLAAMMLSDMGAEVIRIDRPTPANIGIERPDRFNIATRGRRSVAIDLKRPKGVALTLDLIGQADALIEGFRPGVMERLGLGPDACLARNPRLVYGRLTGWGQEGPLSVSAGHDLNYIALTGVLDAIGRVGQPPTPPVNLLGDYAGGSFLMAFGLVSALLNVARGGKGQVVDAAIVDGAALLSGPLMGLVAAGLHRPERGVNLLDSGAPHYEVYRCADGGYISVAPVEGKFQHILLEKIGLVPAEFPDLSDWAGWDEARRRLAGHFAEKTRAEWCRILEGSDACFAPVLTLAEAPVHPHAAARGAYVEIGGVTQPAPAPRFSATVPETPTPPEAPGASTESALADWGIDPVRITELAQAGILGRAARPA